MAAPEFDLDGCLAKWQAVKPSETGDMAAAPFLEACESIIAIFDCLGSGLGMVKSDMLGNVTHIRNNLAAFPEGATLHVMVMKDVEAKVQQKDGTTALSLLWLKRALQFLERLLAHLVQNPGMEVAEAARAAYGETLTNHHNFAIRQVFKVAMGVAPTRQAFMAKLGPSEEATVPKLAAILPVFAEVLGKLQGHYVGIGMEKP